MLVKICGIKNLDIANAAIEYGADALGFVFARSKREISINEAKNIVDHLSKDVLKIGVFVDADIDTVNNYINILGLNIAQLHGNESNEYCKNVNAKVVKAISISNKEDVNKVYNYDSLYGYLFDRKGEQYIGGEGKTFNWDFLEGLDSKILDRLILAGGLNKNNIEDAILKVKPFMLDVSSGVEKNGVKDKNLIKEFIEKVDFLTKRREKYE